MPRITTFPTLFDEVKTLSTSKLKEWGYLKENTYNTGIVEWKRRGEVFASIRISIDHRVQPVLTLSYNYNDEPVEYDVALTSIPSNLGVGKVWYFICPNTGKRCRKLYGAGKYFLHRDAFPYAMYEKQTYSKLGRSMDVAFRYYHMMDKIYSEICSKHFKKTYNGKPTKRYTELLKQLEIAREKEHLAIKYLYQIG